MFRKAEKSKSKLRLAITGPAGSGKTYSALQVAFGLGGKIGLICTEHGSGELYSNLGEYDIAELTAPFTVDRYIHLIKEAEKVYDIIIIDSLSHAWAGEGGLLEQHDKITAASKTGNSYTSWGKITPLHNKLIETILQCRSHIIATMRTKTEYSISDENGKKVPKKIGMAPIQRDGMDYEFSVVYDLSVDHLATVTKDRTNIFNNSEPFLPSQETGKLLLSWLNHGVDIPCLSAEQLKEIRELMGIAKISEQLIVDSYGVDKLEEIPTVTFDNIKKRLIATIEKNKGLNQKQTDEKLFEESINNMEAEQ